MLTVAELALFLRTSASRVRPELTLTTRDFLDDRKQVARSLIGEESNGWPALAESTIEEKKRLGFAGQVSPTDPLLRTGEMRESIRAEADETAAGVEGVIASAEIVARWQEMGTAGSEKHRPIPPRPFLSTAMMHSEPQAHEHFGALGMNLLSPPVR